MLDRYAIKAEESVFIDDNFINIEVAKSLGFLTIHITENTDLADELSKIGVKI